MIANTTTPPPLERWDLHYPEEPAQRGRRAQPMTGQDETFPRVRIAQRRNFLRPHHVAYSYNYVLVLKRPVGTEKGQRNRGLRRTDTGLKRHQSDPRSWALLSCRSRPAPPTEFDGGSRAERSGSGECVSLEP